MGLIFSSSFQKDVIRWFLFILLTFVVVWGIWIYQQTAVSNIFLNIQISNAKDKFNAQLAGDTRTLFVSAQPLLSDPNILELFLAKDRNSLYAYASKPFFKMRDSYLITHFYFVEPDGNCFLRVHSKDLYGDIISRQTMLSAQKTLSPASGLELGKTAFALRAVSPYLDGNKLVGFLELGEEISHFLKDLSKNNNDYYAMVVPKSKFKESDWNAMSSISGQENKWGVFKDYLVIDDTFAAAPPACFSQESVDKVFSGQSVIESIGYKNKKYLCGGFSFNDSLGKQAGIIFSVIEVSNIIGLIEYAYFGMIFVSVLVFGILIIIYFDVRRLALNPLKSIILAAKNIRDGKFSGRLNFKIGGDMQLLGDTLDGAIASLAKMDEEHKQVDKVKTEFLSITSHELRSPMTPMRAQLQMLLGDYFGKLNDKQKDALNIVLRNTERLDRIIQDFLEISRIEAARLKFNFIKVNLEPYIKNLIEEMRSFLPEKKVTIELRMDKLNVIEVDPDRSMQVLRNLVNNALKFSPKNGKIIVTVTMRENDLLFSVKDDGIGIAPENQIRMFEPFYQEEQTMYRQYGGTGLGLAICKGIVESQKGVIWFDSKGRNMGTTFYFTIPFTPTKEIAPIRLLFSQKEDVEQKLLSIFIDFLGPMGKTEFELHQKLLTAEKLTGYIKELKDNKIISENNAANFILSIEKAFEGEKASADAVSKNDKKESGFV